MVVRTSNKHLPPGEQTPYNLRAGLYFALQKCTDLLLVAIPSKWNIVDFQEGGVSSLVSGQYRACNMCPTAARGH